MTERPAFFYDFSSPYAYLASLRIGELFSDAEWRPFAYPALLYERGRLEEVMGRDFEARLVPARERAAERGLPPIATPPGWPNETWSLDPLRMAAFADESGRAAEFTVAAFRKLFVEGLPLNDLVNLRAAAEEAELDPDAAVEALDRQEMKDRVVRNGDEAKERGVDGIPTLAIGDRLFWGEDRLDEAVTAKLAQ